RSESDPSLYPSTSTRRGFVQSPTPTRREILCRCPSGHECTGRSPDQDQWHRLAELNTGARLQSETNGTAAALQKLPYGRYSNFSITTSFSFCRGFFSLAITKNARESCSCPAAGTPDVNTCSNTTGAPACMEGPRTVLKVARPDSQCNECVRVPGGPANSTRLPGT